MKGISKNLTFDYLNPFAFYQSTRLKNLTLVPPPQEIPNQGI